MAEELNKQAESEETQEKDVVNETENKAQDTETPVDNVAEEKDPMTEMQEKYDTLNNKYLRLYSEFENYRRRTAKEKLDSLKNSGSDMVGDLLPVVDDFDRAMTANETNDDPTTLKEGFGLIRQKLVGILERQGLKPMDSIGKPFDTEYHEAITNIPAPSKDLKGKVVDVAEKGYFYNDNILRYAKVIVGQ